MKKLTPILFPFALFYCEIVSADSTSISVTNNNESGAGSLAAAITTLNSQTSFTDYFVYFTNDTSISLTSHSLPAITRPNNTYILGQDSDGNPKNVSITGNDTYQIFTIDATANASPTAVTFGNVTITHGKSSGGTGGGSNQGGSGGGGGGFGGGILAMNGGASTLTVSTAGYAGNSGASVSNCNATGGNGGSVGGSTAYGGGGGGSILGAAGGNGSVNGTTFIGGAGGGGGSVVQYTYAINNGTNASNDTAGPGGVTGGGNGGTGGLSPGVGSNASANWYGGGGAGGGVYKSVGVATGANGGNGSSGETSAGGGGGGGGTGRAGSDNAQAGNGGTGGFGAGGGGGGGSTATGGTATPGTGGQSTSYAGVTYGGAGANGGSNGGQGGGGAGLGGGLFAMGNVAVQATTATSPFTSNTVTAGTGANNGQAKGKDVFLKSGEFDLTLNSAYADNLDVYILKATTSSGGLVLSSGASDYEYSGVLSGLVDGIKKSGTGKLTLSAANTITTSANTSSGYFYIDQGTVALSGAGSIDSSLIVSLNADATAGLDISQKTADLTLPNLIAGAGSTITLGTKKLTFGSNGSSTAIDGVIGGATAGQIEKQGAGTATLTGVNLYTGTTTISAGTLALSGSGSLAASPVNVSNASAIFDISNVTSSTTVGSIAGVGSSSINLGGRTLITNGNDATTQFSGVISGSSGSLTKNGSGTLTLSGTNTYTGVTTISSGVLSVDTINDGGVAGNLGQASNDAGNIVLDGGTLQYTGSTGSTDRSFTITAAQTGAIDVSANTLTMSGGSAATTGALTKAGAGTLILTGTNNATGTTTVSAGTLELSGSGTISSSSPVNISNSGAIFDVSNITGGTITTASISGVSGSSIVLGSKILSTNGDNTSTTFAGAISGTNALFKTGSGTLTLSGDSSGFTGTTTISEGTLNCQGVVGNDIPLKNSSITISTNGTLKGSEGAVGSVSNLGICAPGASIGVLHVFGDYVQDTNATLEIELDDQLNSDFLDVHGGATLDGTLQIIPAPGTYTAGSTYWIIGTVDGVSGTFATVISTDPEVNFEVLYQSPNVYLLVLQNIVGIAAPGNPTVIWDYINSLDQPSGSDLEFVFSNLAALETAPLNEGLNELHDAFFKDLVALNYNNQKDIIRSYISQIQDVYTSRLDGECFSKDKKAHIWIRPLFYYKKQKDFDSIQGQLGYKGNSEGLSVGADYFWQNFGLGISASYTYDALAWNYYSPLTHKKDAGVNSGFVGTYISGFGRHWFIDASLSGSLSNYITKRRIFFGNIDRVARGHHSGWGWCAHAEGGLNVFKQTTNPVYFQPYFEFDSYNVFERSFKETGAESINLDVASKKSAEIQTLLGMRVFKNFSISKACVQPKFSAGWVYEQPLTSKWYRAKFTGQETGFAVKSAHKKQSQMMVAGDILASKKDDHSPLFSLHYELDFGRKYLGQHLNFKVEKDF